MKRFPFIIVACCLILVALAISSRSDSRFECYAHAGSPATRPAIASRGDIAQSMQALLDAGNDAGLELKAIQTTYVDGTVQAVTPVVIMPPSTQPTTKPALPAGKLVFVGPSRAIKSLDDVNFNASPKTTYLLDRDARIRLNKKQAINVPGVVIQTVPGEGEQATLDCFAAGWKQQQYSYSASAADCGFKDVAVVGHDGGDVAAIYNAPRFILDHVNQRESIYRGGVGLFITFGCQGVNVTDSSTVRTGRYSGYSSSTTVNADVHFIRCKFGPSKLVEVKDDHTNMSKISEHCFRGYTLQNLVIDSCTFDNSTNVDGKQAMKLMSGNGAKIINSTFLGSTRFGRDVNDPPGNTLKNVTIGGCAFTDWFRVDPGANVTIVDSNLSSHGSGSVFDLHGDARISVKNIVASYPGGKFTNSPTSVTNLGGCSFNGATVR
jgi:hypothetical protein